ncbi:GspE/PulE family protein [Lichenihabitans sp. Uapishka_5]|uniref:GspE/PulE family protein n=1 Tax=Lichenihabitans sp. Uapishka_5 TaxID=3037302 RepID=UPI0029E7D437|nr:GspE/PulE family protein [Lichenihabitans sp. Uapishka_5]MDX7951715.1 GspE/PulE family protein [Lichenihabitans sp. Uapishka_5]
MPKAFGILRALAPRPRRPDPEAHGDAVATVAAPVEAAVVPARDVLHFVSALVASGRLDAAHENRAAAALRQTMSGTDCSILTDLGLIEEVDLVAALAEFHDSPVATADTLPAEWPSVGAVPSAFWSRSRMLPLADEPDRLRVAVVDIFAADKREALAHLLDKPVVASVIGASVFETALRTLGSGEEAAHDLPGDAGDAADDLARLQDVASQAPIIRLGSRLLKTAFELNASDIHIEPGEADIRVRYRVDGVLVGAETLPKAVQMALTTRFKILAGLNIAELRLPQDGRMKVVDRGAATDLRVAALPTANGEALVMRILRQSRKVGTLGSLGFSAAAEARLGTMIGRPNGIVLVSGPTGSGKTTTLYTALAMLNGTERKIITVEDPVEYRIAGVSQVQTHAAIGLDFATALRSILRQDPDIVMIGEIRDGETARIAVQAALTGHLVLSTIHTNSAAATVTRLVEMGIEPYLIAATLNGVVAQRLVRSLCSACAQPEPGSPHRMRPGGCPQCSQAGFKGRSVVGEVMPVDAILRDLITDKATAGTLEAAAIRAGMATLAVSALAKVEAGETTLEEVLRHIDLGPASVRAS